MTRLPLALQTAYADLLDKAQDAAIGEAEGEPGGFIVKTVKGRRYWYRQTPGGDGRPRQTYVGPETPELLQRIERSRLIRNDLRARRDLVRALVRSGAAPAPAPRVGRLLEALAAAGVFRLRAVLVGTMAYQTHGPMLGVRLSGAALMTEDIDVAQFRSVSVAVEDTVPADLLDILRVVEPDIRPVTKVFDDRSPIGYLAGRPGGALKLEFLTPMRGPDEDGPGQLPALATGAQPLRFLDYLIYQEQKAVVLHGAGVLVNVPDPTRFAFHKLIVSQRRTNLAKAHKDLVQAQTLLDVLVQDRPGDVADFWEDLCGRGEKWRSLAMAGLSGMDADVKDRVVDIVKTTPR